MFRTWLVDGRVVAVAGLAALSVACGGGAQRDANAPEAMQSAPISLGRIDRANVYPSVAALGRTVAVAWNARNELQSDVYVSVSTDGGATFGQATRVNDLVKDANISGEQPARIVIAPGNVLHVVWPSRQDGRAVLRYASSADLGKSFTRPSTIAGEREPGIRGWQSVAIGYDGGVHALWLDGRNAASAPPHHHGAQKPGAGAAQGKSMGKAPRQDVFHAAWKGDSPRSENAVAAEVCFCCKTAIATAGDRVYAAWRDIHPGSVRDIAVARSTDNGATFAAPVRVSEDNWKIEACPDDGPSMAADSHGGIHIAWPTLVAGAQPRKGIFYASLDGTGPGMTFSPRLRLDAGDGDAAHPQLASDDHGNTAIVWDERAVDRRRIVVRRVSGGAAAPAEQFEGAGVSYPAVAAADGHWIVVWPQQTPDGSSLIAGRRLAFTH